MFWNASRQEKRAQATEFPSSDSIGQRGEGMLGFHWSKFKTDRRLLYGLKRFQTERASLTFLGFQISFQCNGHKLAEMDASRHKFTEVYTIGHELENIKRCTKKCNT